MNKLISLRLVDDDPAIRDLWTRQLNRKAGFEITGVFADAFHRGSEPAALPSSCS
ncbi:MAG: hypothetical protein HZA92_06770 [Verrucomicrobia bacterium]|nr:hypothetical protein [Verrucomicrobiota bacterium]